MTHQSRQLLRYLDRFIGDDTGRNTALRKFHLDTTKRALPARNLWRHKKALVDPSQSTALVYLLFLHRHGELIPSKTPGELFRYKHPQWLK